MKIELELRKRKYFNSGIVTKLSRLDYTCNQLLRKKISVCIRCCGLKRRQNKPRNAIINNVVDLGVVAHATPNTR